jgi:hypothetical protein
MWTGGHIPVRVVNVRWTDLSGYNIFRGIIFSVIPFYLQSIYTSTFSKLCKNINTCIQWHVEECSVALLCN